MSSDVVADRAVDVVVAGSSLTVLLADVEHVALIFSLVAGGVYYAVKTYIALRERKKE